MIDIRPLTRLNLNDFNRLVTGYTSGARYRASRNETENQFSLTLELEECATPYVKRYEPPDAETLENYRQVPHSGFSFGAYDSEQCVGMALAEPRFWNRSLWVLEFHVAETHRGRGIGRQLLDKLVQKARDTYLRTVVCETQNTNLPAINFYRKMGFHIEGIDLSYYSNQDYPDGEIAIFMKKRVEK